jgi:SAM-dependent methyltransferase
VTDGTSAASRYPAVIGAWSDIQDHIPRLRSEARGTVLELGVRGGISTTALLAGVEERGGVVWSVDIDPASAAIFEGHAQWRFALADSRDVDAVSALGLERPLDVLFVDTIHTYEQVRDELGAWGEWVRPGGVILFHDTDSYPEIRRAISEWCRPRKVPYEFLGGSYGLGVAYPGAGRLARYGFAVKRAAWHSWRATLAAVSFALAAIRFPGRVARRLRREVTRRR